MLKRKWYEWFLTIVYFAMVILCIALNLEWFRNIFKPENREPFNSFTMAVNAFLFLIVAIVCLAADFGSFAPMNAIIKDLKAATNKRMSDAMNAHTYL